MSEIKLRPRPFCGGEAEMFSIRGEKTIRIEQHYLHAKET